MIAEFEFIPNEENYYDNDSYSVNKKGQRNELKENFRHEEILPSLKEKTEHYGDSKNNSNKKDIKSIKNIPTTLELLDLLKNEVESRTPNFLTIDGMKVKMIQNGKLSWNKLSLVICDYERRLNRIRRNIRKNPNYKVALDELQKWVDNIRTTLGAKGKNAINYIDLYRKSNPNLPASSEFKVLKYHPNLQMDYFEKINTKDKAYWLGVLWAEVYIGKNSAIKLEISKKDETLIDRYIKALGLNPNAKKNFERERKLGIKSYLRIRFKCPKMVDHLLKLGYTPPKLKETKFPTLDSRKLDLAFLLGFFDGEGKEGTNQLHLGSRKILDQIKEKFGKDIPHNIRPDKEGYWYLSLGGKLFNEMMLNYKDSLLRKRKFFRVPVRTKFENSITKEKLSNMIWSMPIKEICKKYGVYRRIVVNVCEKWGIERPHSHYWHNRLHGKPFDKIS